MVSSTQTEMPFHEFPIQCAAHPGRNAVLTLEPCKNSACPFLVTRQNCMTGQKTSLIDVRTIRITGHRNTGAKKTAPHAAMAEAASEPSLDGFAQGTQPPRCVYRRVDFSVCPYIGSINAGFPCNSTLAIPDRFSMAGKLNVIQEPLPLRWMACRPAPLSVAQPNFGSRNPSSLGRRTVSDQTLPTAKSAEFTDWTSAEASGMWSMTKLFVGVQPIQHRGPTSEAPLCEL